MAGQEVKLTLKFGFQVYRQFVCEDGIADRYRTSKILNPL